MHGPGFVAFLRDLQSRIGEPAFLVITNELALLTISEHRRELEGLYYFRLPTHDAVLMLHDKARFHESAAEHGWPVRAPADLPKIESLRLPMTLKPADKRHLAPGQPWIRARQRLRRRGCPNFLCC
jgi:predicted ATP-grasp superfamily ATP-dependent carboligase